MQPFGSLTADVKDTATPKNTPQNATIRKKSKSLKAQAIKVRTVANNTRIKWHPCYRPVSSIKGFQTHPDRNSQTVAGVAGVVGTADAPTVAAAVAVGD